MEELVNFTDQWRIQDFPEVGAPTLRGAPTYDFAKLSQNLHEIERIWTPVARVPRAPSDPPLQIIKFFPFHNSIPPPITTSFYWMVPQGQYISAELTQNLLSIDIILIPFRNMRKYKADLYRSTTAA